MAVFVLTVGLAAARAGAQQALQPEEAGPVELSGPAFRERPALPSRAVELPPWAPESLRGLPADPRVGALVRDLGSESFERREAASRALLDPAIPDAQVWLHLSGACGPLGHEAHARLLEVGRTRIVDAPRGALGIQMAGRFASPDGVVITALIPNMPARLVLKPGDRIVQLDGKPIQVDQQLSSIVQTKRPGERIKVVVMRGERDELGRVRGGPDGRPVETRVEVDMEVGSRADLERFGGGGLDTPLVDSGRERMAQQVADAFPAPVRSLRTERLAGEPVDVDAHPDVVQLKEQIGRPEGLEGGAGVRAVLRARLAALEAAARAPGLEEHERAWFRAVADRYRELIPEALRPEGAPAPRRGASARGRQGIPKTNAPRTVRSTRRASGGSCRARMPRPCAGQSSGAVRGGQAPRQAFWSPERGFLKCASCIGATMSRTRCRITAGDPTASTSWTIARG